MNELVPKLIVTYAWDFVRDVLRAILIACFVTAIGLAIDWFWNDVTSAVSYADVWYGAFMAAVITSPVRR